MKWRKAIAAGLTVAMLYSPAYAAVIQIYNIGDSARNEWMFFKTDPSGNESQDAEDAPWSAYVGDSLEIFSSPETHPFGNLDYDTRPLNTPGINVNLAVVGSPVTSNNQLVIRVLDDSNLEYRNLIAYNTADPTTVYVLDKQNGAINYIDLPDLVSQAAGTYATWRIETPAIVSGDIASFSGVGTLDGEVDFYDIKALADEWLEETLEGENYLWGDIDYDGVNNFEDFAVQAANWKKEE